MISFLIPVYNFNIVNLAKDLCSQAEALGLSYELIALDDASTNKDLVAENQAINQINNARFELLDHNHGRSKIRNLLASKAQGEWLLFLDCDSGVIRNDFISKYLSFFNEADLICGGREYNPKAEEKYRLHTSYGVEREKGSTNFMTNNFFIKRSIFSKVRFNENILGYGHEDTLFGQEVLQEGFKIKYIDNPILHLDLKDNDAFIRDNLEAAKNLALLYQNPQHQNKLHNLKIIKTYEKLNRYKMTKIYCLFVSVFKSLIIKQLHGTKPNLKLLDILKLESFITTL